MISNINQFLFNYIANDIFGIILMFSTVIGFILSVWQRQYHEMSKSKNKSKSYWGVTFNQISTLFDFIVSSVLFFYSAQIMFSETEFIPHYDICLIFIFCVIFRKIGLFLTYKKMVR